MADAAVDVVIFGASGFTGKYVVRELLKFSKDGSRRVALAGRHRAKLAAALEWAAAPASPPTFPLLEADVDDPQSLLAMCRRTKLVLNCVGPFRLYGQPVVAACVEAGIDYLDITGEPEFMERMDLLYHQAASDRGSLIVSACGYDSIPAEFGLLHHLKQWVAPSLPNSVDCFLQITSSTKVVGNLGTWESAVLGVSSASDLRKMRAKTKNSKVRVHVPGAPAKKPSLLYWNKHLSLWAMYLPSADSAVVRRTMSTAASGAPPSIAEAEDPNLPAVEYARKLVSIPVHFGVYSALPNIFAVFKQLWMGISVICLAAFAFGRRLLLRFPEVFSFGLFHRGGPSEEQVAAARFKMWFVGKGYSDSKMATSSHAPTPDLQMTTVVSGPEIGYITTPICLVQCALIVLHERRSLPRGGVYTPGTVFGTTDLQQRLEDNGISFEFMSKQNI
ncbi:hypothetical protein GOP47_0013732 [Adiantum capillus-veneris]|uniref:Saccharopine dehydrogenase NADP binding domain-containing protein n=1 Tax=Adiantum capillus-veneris TaxID=13818 RepID=A0A9D4UPA6_ADICA|nr:hypothetical protein GOP47_0013732 [Adiantum capillus-veneris]